MDLDAFLQSAVDASWQGTLALLIILALRPLLSAWIPVRWRMWLWMLVLIRLLVPGFLLPQSPASMQNFMDGEPTVQRIRLAWASPPRSAEVKAPAAADSIAMARRGPAMIEWRRLAAQVWLAGAGLLAAWLVCGAMALQRRLKRDGTAAEEAATQIWRTCCARVAVRSGPRLIVTEAVASPALVGLFRPALLLPRRAVLSREDLEHIFLHELAHYRRGDHWTHFAQLGALCFHWCNPLVWMGFRFFRADRELAADEWALRHLAEDRRPAYGETLLRLLSTQAAPDLSRCAIGILEDGALLRTRLRRILNFRSPGVFGTMVGLVLVGALAALILTVAKTPAAGLRRWSVVSLAIPKSGEIKDAYVKLQSPAGRAVTLTTGEVTKEGVMLEKVEWSGSPIRAAVTLRQGDERTELWANATRISRNNDLTRKAAQVEIEAKFIEFAEEEARKVPLLNLATGGRPGEAAGKVSRGALAGVINADQTEELIRKLNETKGVDLLSAPRVSTRSQQRAVVEMIREFRYPIAWDPPTAQNQHWTPKTFTTQNLGLTLGVEATLVEDTIDLNLSPAVGEFLGFIDYETKQPLAQAKHAAGASLLDRTLDPGAEPDAKLSDRTEPVFQTRQSTTSVSIFSGQSVVLILSDAEPARGAAEPAPFPKPGAGKVLVAVITAHRLDPAGEPPKSTAATATSAPSVPPEGVPTAQSVPDKPGFVTSPHSPGAGYIDVRGIPTGTEVKDPYSGRLFRVP